MFEHLKRAHGIVLSSMTGSHALHVCHDSGPALSARGRNSGGVQIDSGRSGLSAVTHEIEECTFATTDFQNDGVLCDVVQR